MPISLGHCPQNPRMLILVKKSNLPPESSENNDLLRCSTYSMWQGAQSRDGARKLESLPTHIHVATIFSQRLQYIVLTGCKSAGVNISEGLSPLFLARSPPPDSLASSTVIPHGPSHHHSKEEHMGTASRHKGFLHLSARETSASGSQVPLILVCKEAVAGLSPGVHRQLTGKDNVQGSLRGSVVWRPAPIPCCRSSQILRILAT